jgi:hypothetical protein
MRTIRSGFKCFLVGVALCGLWIALPSAAQQNVAAPKESFDALSIRQIYRHLEGGVTSARKTCGCVPDWTDPLST